MTDTLSDTGLDYLNAHTCPKGVHADWAVDSEHTHACPWCRIDELTAEVVELKAKLASAEAQLDCLDRRYGPVHEAIYRWRRHELTADEAMEIVRDAARAEITA